jgi:hypothetical protein
MSRLILPILFLFLIQLCSASELAGILPVTNKILMLHFDDGKVLQHGLGQGDNDDVMQRSSLSLSRAQKITSYSIISSNDAQYSAATEPLQIGRKSKGKDFTRNWPDLPYVSEHFIYLELPHALLNGASYTLTLKSLVQNGDEWTFVFDDKKMRSETVHVNQIGYAPRAPQKFAYLSHWMGDLGPLELDAFAESKFYLIDVATETAVFSGEIKQRKDLQTGGPDCAYPDHAPFGSYTGADVWLIDFSDFNTPGDYRIAVDGIGCSYPFRLHADVYREAFYTTVRALYHQRCGVALEQPYTEFTRGRCHHPAETDTVILSTWKYMDGGNAFTQLPRDATDEKKPFHGGWHDAADWDKHHNHMNASRYLLMAYELKPENFSDNELNIPESGNGIPDIIDEARWCIDFFKSMQDEDGGIHGGIETHRHPGAGISCVTDTDQWYAYAPDPLASLNYAAAACQLAYCLKIAGDDSPFDDYSVTAKKAFQWALDHSSSANWNEQRFRDSRHLASAWLFKVTGEEMYHNYFKTDNKITSNSTELEVWNSHDQQWGAWTYITTDQPNIDAALKTRLENATVAWAKSDHTANADRRGYQYGNDWWLPIAWGQATRPRVFPVYMAYVVTGDDSYLGYHYTSVDYILGANPLNMCWVTGLGEKSPQEIMHIDSWFYNDGSVMVPGFIPYGPQSYTEDTPDGPWEVSWGQKTTYPHASEWPSHELYFENRYCPAVGEFTVHESIGPAAAAFGLLCEPGGVFSRIEKDANPITINNFELLPNYPNPFNMYTIIPFSLNEAGIVKVEIYDVRGRLVRTRLHELVDRGEHVVRWDGHDNSGRAVASGLYVIRMSLGGETKTGKAVVLR